MKVKINRDFEELIPSYLGRRKQDIITIQSGLQSKDFGIIKEIGHKLKGNGASYGFITLTEIGSRLETAGEKQDVNSIQKCCQELEDYLSELEIEFIDCENR